jgi:hypothetical protein
MHTYCAEACYVPALFEYHIIVTREVLSFCIEHGGHKAQEQHSLVINSILRNNDIRVVKKLQKLAEEKDDEVYMELADAFVNNS